MKHLLAKLTVTAGALSVCLLLSGCVIKTSPEELYSLPQLPAEYTELQAILEKEREDGAEYAAPVSGTNIQPVQMVDLNDDGQEEALAFFRKSTDEKPLKIYIFSPDGQSYRQTAVIEGSGTSIYSIAYSDLDKDGHTELLVGWKVSTELQALSVYSLRSGEPEELMRTPYVKYALSDLDQNKDQEIMVFRSDGEGSGIAECYGWQGGAMSIRSSAFISMTMAELSDRGRVRNGTLLSGESALFITGVSDSVSITDILAIRNGELTNITLSDMTGVSREVSRFLSLYPTDINGDGVTEIPVPVSLPSRHGDWGDGIGNYRIDWCQYALDGTRGQTVTTYHDIDDGWYLTLPEDWRDRLLVTRSQSGADEMAVTFSLRDGAEEAEDILRIYTITGDSPEYKIRGNRFLLNRQAGTIFAAEILGGAKEQAGGMTRDNLRAAFNLIMTEWLPGDN